MTVYEIRLLVEAEDRADVDPFVEAVKRLACPISLEDDPDHRCPRRWFLVSSALDETEAREVEPLLED